MSGPKSLQREATTSAQKEYSEDTIIWGLDNAFPLRLAETVQSSPAASSCIGTRTKFIKGAGFSNPDLMRLKVNKTGQTLWDLHSILSASLALFRGFSVNFKFNELGKITNSYNLPIENLRFVKPVNDLDPEIRLIKYNPYFGTVEYKREYTTQYHLFNLEELRNQISDEGTNFRGQVYYYGETKPLFRFYPVPDYWSAENWMRADAEFQKLIYKEVDNGFFQSVIWNMIGDPSHASKNPKYQREETDSNGIKRKVSTKTLGEEFDEWMSEHFSGADKAGTAVVLWSMNKDQTASVQAFPVNVNSERLLTQQDLTTKNITIATRTPGILANISEGVNLGSGGSEIQKAVELMQSDTVDDRKTLEQFYNETLLPNMDGISTDMKVEIVNYNPISVPVEIDDKFWDELTSNERRNFIRKSFPGIQLDEAVVQVDEDGVPIEPIAEEVHVNEHIKNLSGRQKQNFERILRDYRSGKASVEQTKIFLSTGFGLTESEINAILGIQEDTELQVA